MKNKTGIFLMELIVAILFFSLSSAICVQLFVKAHTMNNDSIYKTQASKLASNIAEIYMNGDFNQYYQNASTLYFNDQLELTDLKDCYKVEIDEKNYTLNIHVYRDEQNYFDLSVKHYVKDVIQ